MKLKTKSYVYSFVLTFLFAAAGGLVTYLGMSRYDKLIHPFLTPPGWLFPVVWTVLFVLMAFGCAKVYASESPLMPKAIFVYTVQLTMNFWWCLLFFGFGLYFTAFIWLLLLWAVVLVMIILFYRINKLWGLLQIFYLLWLSFAAYLNYGIWSLN